MKKRARDSKGHFISNKSAKARATKKSGGKKKHGASEKRSSPRPKAKQSGSRPAAKATHKSGGSKKGGGRSGGGMPQSPTVIVVNSGAKEGKKGGGKKGHHKGGHHKSKHWGARETPKASFGGLAIFVPSSILGMEVADDLHRTLVTVDPATAAAPGYVLPTGMASAAASDVYAYNRLAIVARPSWVSIGAQAAVSLLGWLAGAFMPWAPIKMVAYGFATGALLNPIAQLASAFIMQPLFATTNWGARAFGEAIVANGKLYGTTVPTGFLGNMSQARAKTMFGLGAPSHDAAPQARPLPTAQPQRIPDALATLGCAPPQQQPAPGRPAQPPAVVQAPPPAALAPAPVGAALNGTNGAPPREAAPVGPPTYRAGSITRVLGRAA